MKKYDNYKNSGVEWLGEIPEHWKVKKVTHIFNKIGSGTTPTAGTPKYYDNGHINWLQTGDLNDGIINETNKKITFKAINDFSTLKQYLKGSIVIAMYGATIGKLGYLNIETTTNQACCVLENPNQYLSKFGFYSFMNAKTSIISMSYGGGQPNISQDLVKSLRLVVPPIQEQISITNFLDDKTTKIDQAIAIKQKQIELLKERRQILIHKAVTRGLNENVKLKDSGVEWIGEIPEHWEVKRLKYFVNIQGGFAFNSSHFKDEGVQIIKIANTYLNELCLDRQPTFVEKSFLKTHKEWIVSKGDILMSLTGTLGKKDYGFAILIENNEQYLLNQRVAKITMKKGFEPDYILNILRSEMYLNQLYMLPSGTKQANLSNDNVINIKVAFPTNQIERVAILEYIKNVTTKIATAISLKEQEIEKLKEYKMSLIDGVVTGKVRVTP